MVLFVRIGLEGKEIWYIVPSLGSYNQYVILGKVF